MSDEVQERRDAVVHGLLPIVRVADQPLRWTIDERLAHHGCPGVGIAVMHDGHIDWADGFGLRHTDRPHAETDRTVFIGASTS